MKRKFSVSTFLLLAAVLFNFGCGEDSDSTKSPLSPQEEIALFDDLIDKYKNCTKEELYRMYPGSKYKQGPSYSADDVLYLTSNSVGSGVDAETAFDMTPEIKSAILSKGFAVDGSQRFNNPLPLYKKIFQNDLPVLITTDTILHSWHKSYDDILKELETYPLTEALTIYISDIRSAIPDSFSSDKEKEVYNDIDILFSTAFALLGKSSEPYAVASDNENEVKSLVNMCLEAEEAETIIIFGEERKEFDFTKFKPRGHYTESQELSNYFRAVTWLGLMDLKVFDSARQFRMAQVLSTILPDDSQGTLGMKALDNLLGALVGPNDSMTPFEMRTFTDDHSISSVLQLDDEAISYYQGELVREGYGQQLIISQYLGSNPFSSEPREFPISFTVLGQRYTIDSEVFTNVVYDRIIVDDKKIKRPLPAAFDAMFALGDNLALELLSDELDEYSYSGNLACMRKIIDTRDDAFWAGSVYHSTLKNLENTRSVSENAPAVFQQKPWAKKMLSARLGFWSQLRHDNLLYIKQSSTSGVMCEYPDGYVEPYPEFYKGMSETAQNLKNVFETYLDTLETSGFYSTYSDSYTYNSNYNEYFSSYAKTHPIAYLENFSSLCNTLTSMAEKELNGESFSSEEISFIQNWYKEVDKFGCGYSKIYKGKIFQFNYEIFRIMSTYDDEMSYYFDESTAEDPDNPEPIYFAFEPEIADVHTCPESTIFPLQILSVATGGVLPVFTAVENPFGDVVLYTGAAYDYYEFSDDVRYSDEEWEALFDAGTVPDKPSWMDDSEGGYITY